MYSVNWPSVQQFADNEELHAEWAAAKMASKHRLAQYVLQVTGVIIDPNSLFDIQVKRIHEYKRQLLNILGAVYRYKKLKVQIDFPISEFRCLHKFLMVDNLMSTCILCLPQHSCYQATKTSNKEWIYVIMYVCNNPRHQYGSN